MDIDYNLQIYDRYKQLKNSGKEEYDNNDLWKIFEWLMCIHLSNIYDTPFYEYSDIDPEFKEANNLSTNDTGIDLCDLKDTIVQCKLRLNSLTWRDCATFFGSQVIFDEQLNQQVIRWKNLIIARNKESTLSKNLVARSKLFTDITKSRKWIIKYCENLMGNPPEIPKIEETNFELRDYQQESINLINHSEKNVIICLPTGTGKNVVIIHSMENDKKYLILVPRIILMDQLKDEIIKHKPEFTSEIQTIGDGHNVYDKNKNITICVYNSVHLVRKYLHKFTKIFIDEAHHIYKPEIYTIDESDYDSDENVNSDDEIDEDTYLDIITKLKEYDNNVYLSATIDKIDDFDFYKKDIRDMIEQKYLCDYIITIPIFNDDPSNKNICQYLLKNYIHIIVYCESHKEGIKIYKLLNKLQNNSAKYIDCNTPKRERNKIINEYKKGNISFLVNVRILVEGFDAPITKGVCFMHLPNKGSTLIQIIGRALRLHSLKSIANIILPFSCKEDEGNINNFLKVMARNDKRILKSYQNKKVGGYVNIVKSVEEKESDENEDENEDNDNEDEDDIELKYEMVFDSMGKLKNGPEIWNYKLEKVKKYIDENHKTPSSTDKNKDIKVMGQWISTQKTNYPDRKYIMSNDEIHNLWTNFITSPQYKNYFISNEEQWKNTLKEIKKYIDENHKRPSETDKNKEIKVMGKWISTQKTNYPDRKQIMSNDEIHKLWTTFITSPQYKKYFPKK